MLGVPPSRGQGPHLRGRSWPSHKTAGGPPLSACLGHNLEDVEEEGDHVHIECECRKDVLLGRDCKRVPASHHQLGVEQNVRAFSVLVGVTNNLQNHEEQVDNVNVEAECSEDVLFRRYAVLMVASKHHLGIKY